MRFAIQRERLLRPLQLLAGVVERRQTLPILGNVLMATTDKELELHTTDLELGMVIRVPLEAAEAGETTLPARKLMDIVRALPEDSALEISAEQGRGVIRCGASRFALATLPPGDFPRSDSTLDGTSLSLPQKQLRGLIEATHFSMAQQDVRYYLNGMLLELGEGRLRGVATDGHRLALADLDTEAAPERPVQILLPRKAVMELLRLLEGGDDLLELRLGEHQAQFNLNDVAFSSKLIDGRFPEYARVIPSRSEKLLVAEREALRQALVRVAILTNEQSRAVCFHLATDRLQVVTHNPDQEEAEEAIPVNYRGDEMEIGFNVSYLLDALNVIPDELVSLHLSDPSSSCLLHAQGSDRCKYVIMPMRL